MSRHEPAPHAGRRPLDQPRPRAGTLGETPRRRQPGSAARTPPCSPPGNERGTDPRAAPARRADVLRSARRAPGCVPGARWPRPDAEEPRRYGPRAPTAPRVGTAARARRPEAHRGALPQRDRVAATETAPGLPGGTAPAACRRPGRAGSPRTPHATDWPPHSATGPRRTRPRYHGRAAHARRQRPEPPPSRAGPPRSEPLTRRIRSRSRPTERRAASASPRSRRPAPQQRRADRGPARRCLQSRWRRSGSGCQRHGRAAAPRPPQDPPPTPGTCRGRRRADPGRQPRMSARAS